LKSVCRKLELDSSSSRDREREKALTRSRQGFEKDT
jgi:hypothetical protein